MIVICQNDYPIGTAASEEHAKAICDRLSAEAEEKRKWEGSCGRRSYFHWHDVPELTP